MAFRLPPPPQAISGQTQLPPPTPFDNYLSLRNSYFNMINNKNDEQSSFAAVDPAAPALVPVPGSTAAAASSASANALHESPFMVDQNDMNNFRELLELCGMTPDGTPALGTFDGSPMQDTPLFTPGMDMLGSTPFLDGWETSPAFEDADSFDAFPSLFESFAKSDNTNTNDNNTATIDNPALLTMPQTPSLPSTLLGSPSESAVGRKGGPTGFRKGTNPTNMVPMDAPTQTRQYLSDSKTSRKPVPAAFQNKARKRQHEELLDDDDVPEDIQDAISAKRRLNTLAARRSRARKAQTALENEERISGLENTVEQLRQELVRVTAERDTYRAQLGLM